MNYIENTIDENNYHLFFDKEEGLVAEKRIADYIFSKILTDSLLLLKKDKDIKNLEILPYSLEELKIQINEPCSHSCVNSWDTKNYKVNIQFNIKLLKEFINTSMFISPEYIENFQIPKDLGSWDLDKINQNINHSVINEKELTSYSFSIDHDVNKWNQNLFNINDFSSTFFTINAIFKYKKDKMLKLLLCELLSTEKNIVLTNENQEVKLSCELKNKENEHILNKINFLVSNPHCDLFKSIKKDNSKIIGVDEIENTFLYDYPASYANKIQIFIEPLIIKSTKENLFSSLKLCQKTLKVNRI